MSATTRAHARVTGIVHGVGFRWFARHLASHYGLSGWVRNQSDGSVELEAEGSRDEVEAFLERIREGPRFAEVESVSVDWMDPQHDSTFEVTG